MSPKSTHSSSWNIRMNLYGQLLGVGGTKSKILLLVTNQKEAVELSISKKYAKAVANRVYRDIGVLAEVKMDGHIIIGGRVVAILDYAPSDFLTWLEKVRKDVGSAFDGIDAMEYIKEIRG